MKLVIKLTGIAALVFWSCTTKKESSPTHAHSEGEHYHHNVYKAQDSVLNHKLIFPSKVPDRVILHLTEHPENSIAVNWRTNAQVTEGFIQIAVATDGPEFRQNGIKRVKADTEYFQNQSKKNNEPLVVANYHSVKVEGLQPNTIYAYRVGNGGEDSRLWSEWYHTTTASNLANKAFSFIYFGDAQNEVKSMWSRLIRSSYQLFPKVDFMLHAGDLINSRDSNLEWGEWFHAGSFIHATVPSVMTPGNHEYRNEVLTPLWRPQFNLPKNGPLKEVEETTYVIDYQDLKLISLDAVSFDDKEHSRNAQVKWLDSILSTNTKKWTALFLHYPVLSVAKKRDEDNLLMKKALQPVIEKYQLDLVLTGHDHTYARGSVKNIPTGITGVYETGTVYAVSVSGPKMYESEDKKWMDRRGENIQLFQIISIENDILNYKAFTPIGNIYDAFEMTKVNGKKQVRNKIPKTQERLKKDFK
ncbi:3',5'-cyclic AMP phosphodiesterase CpdA [Wenyingzhuangia heitensis]|uniref:3',5'-cyclic AMP phosphodiesterase CpdA n=1 Tax=Wenyingzhuangia heitensis TaxID=1487859 RepID=A0ABX0U9A5_9FLAO|nr:metallophosphoesterase family protein [Wenyingzhuangia heitensis]NIJ44365.1 3',5'-cyclic AMP phosphodiesterase CpdA [Wenyingzhuangia heitensis]